MEEKKKVSRVGVFDIVLLIVNALFLVGMLTVFRACAARDDGSWMSCHWANRAVDAIAAALVLLSVIHLAVGDPRRKQGVDLAMIPVALTAAAIPGRLIDLCMMADMRCHRLMAPGAVVFAIVVIAVAVIDFLINIKREKV